MKTICIAKDFTEYPGMRCAHLRDDSGVDKEITQLRLKQIAYAIIIYEDFNRPKATRIIENIKQKLTGKPHTLGIMQYKTDSVISDFDSVRLGVKKLKTDYEQMIRDIKSNPIGLQHNDWACQMKLTQLYNRHTDYSHISCE